MVEAALISNRFTIPPSRTSMEAPAALSEMYNVATTPFSTWMLTPGASTITSSKSPSSVIFSPGSMDITSKLLNPVEVRPSSSSITPLRMLVSFITVFPCAIIRILPSYLSTYIVPSTWVLVRVILFSPPPYITKSPLIVTPSRTTFPSSTPSEIYRLPEMVISLSVTSAVFINSPFEMFLEYVPVVLIISSKILSTILSVSALVMFSLGANLFPGRPNIYLFSAKALTASFAHDAISLVSANLSEALWSSTCILNARYSITAASCRVMLFDGSNILLPIPTVTPAATAFATLSAYHSFVGTSINCSSDLLA